MAAAAHKVDIILERRTSGVVAQLVFDNARRLNVVDPAALRELTRAFRTLAQESELRVVVFAGAGGKAFIGGADMKHMATMTSEEDARGFITLIHELCESIRDCPVPVICRLEGYTLGAGLEVAAACDLRIASDTARFGMPEVKVGIPSVVEAALLPRLIGWGRTARMLLTAETIDAARAEAWGLVEEVVSASEIAGAIERCVGSILDAAPLAVRAQKRLMRRWERLPLDEAVQAGIEAFAESVREGEHTPRMRAFLDRRKS